MTISGFRLRHARLALSIVALTVAGCATTDGRNNPDPFESFNRPIFRFNDVVDRYALRPLAQGYDRYVPELFQLVLGNVFSNFADIYTAANQLLQAKPLEALQDATRVVVNSTFGFLGVGDVASALGLPKHHEDFGQTLGRWGVGSGPYLMLPLLGPSTVRDAPARFVDGWADPLWRLPHDISFRNAAVGLRVVDQRADLLEGEKLIEGLALDRYSLIRDGFLQRRRTLIYDGDPPDELPDYGDEDYYQPAEADKPAAGTGSGNDDGTGKGDGAGKDDDAGKGDGVGKDDGAGKGDGVGKDDDAGKGKGAGGAR